MPKKSPCRKKKSRKPEDMRAEYRFDYTKAKSNGFADQMSKDSIAVVLEPDVVEVFDSSAAINDVLRTVIASMKKSARRTR